MSFRAETAAEAERLGELVRATEYLQQKADRYVAAAEAAHEAGKLVAAGARIEHLTAMKGQLEHADFMLTAALHDAKDALDRARLMSPALSRHTDAAESGRSLTQ